MPKISGPQLIIKLTESILSAQYCQYIYAAVGENLLHDKLEEGFAGFVNDISNEPSEKLTSLDLVHTKMVCLLDLMYSLQQTTTKEVFLDCIHYFKTLESILPNMAARIFHIAFHLNQFLSEERKILDSEDVMHLLAKTGYPQRPIDFEKLENCVECELPSKLDQAIVILLKMANEIPTPSFTSVFQKENCKIFLQEVKQLYSFRRTFESANSFLEHNYSFLQANSNQFPNDNNNELETNQFETQSTVRNGHRPNGFRHLQMDRCSALAQCDARNNRTRRNTICGYPNAEESDDALRNNKCAIRRLSLDQNRSSEETDFLNVCTQTDFPDDGENYCCYSGDHSYSSPEDFESVSSNYSGEISRTLEPLCSGNDMMLELSECSDMEVHDSDYVGIPYINSGHDPGPAEDRSFSGVSGSSAQTNSRIPPENDEVQIEEQQNDRTPDAVTSSGNALSRDCDGGAESRLPRRVRPPKRMLVVYVERLNLDSWLEQNNLLCDDREEDTEEDEDLKTESEVRVSDAADLESAGESDRVSLVGAIDPVLLENPNALSDSAGETLRTRRDSVGEIRVLLQECTKKVASEVERARTPSAPGGSKQSEYVQEAEESDTFKNNASQTNVAPVADADVTEVLQNSGCPEVPSLATDTTLSSGSLEAPVDVDGGDNSTGSDSSGKETAQEEPQAKSSYLYLTRCRHNSLESRESPWIFRRHKRLSLSETRTGDAGGERRSSVRLRNNSASPNRPPSARNDDSTSALAARRNASADANVCARCASGRADGYSLRRKKTSADKNQRQNAKRADQCVKCGCRLATEMSETDEESPYRATRSRVKQDSVAACERRSRRGLDAGSGAAFASRSNRLPPSRASSRKSSFVDAERTVVSGCDDAERRKRPLEETEVLAESSSADDEVAEDYFTLPAKRCRPLETLTEESSQSCGRLSSSSSCGSGSVEHSPRVKHKLYTGAADKIMAISRRRLNEDCMLLDSEIKYGPKALRSIRTLAVPSNQNSL